MTIGDNRDYTRVLLYSYHMSYSLNSLKGVIWGTIKGTTIGVIKGDTRSLDYGSYHYYRVGGGGPPNI